MFLSKSSISKLEGVQIAAMYINIATSRQPQETIDTAEKRKAPHDEALAHKNVASKEWA